MSEGNRKIVGTILSGASTSKATCLIRKEVERGLLKEGMLVIIRSRTREEERDILARIESIQPIDESYETGGFLTEAIKEGLPIPSDISRRYEIAELSLLFRLGSATREVRYPPLAGDPVLLISNVEQLSHDIFGVTKDNLIVEYGTLAGYKNLPVLLNIEALPMHIAVFGITGSGKSFNVGALIEKLADIRWKDGEKIVRKNFPVIAIDANGDYVDYWEHFVRFGNLGVYPKVIRYIFSMRGITAALPSNCKLHPYDYVKVFNIDLNEFKDSPRDLAEAIITYYAGDISGRELQISGLTGIFNYMIKKSMIADLNALFTNNRLYQTLCNMVNHPPEGISISSQTRDAILRQLDTFKRDIADSYALIGKTKEPFTESTVDQLVKKGGMAVIDFTVTGAPGYPSRVKQLIVYYISYVLFKSFVNYKIKEPQQRSLLYIIEEAQNYCPNLAEYKIGYSLARDILHRIATQGRKFGLCLCLITQRPSYVDPVVISMCNSFFIHRIAPGDESFVKKITGGLPPSLERRLSKLSAGEVIITGQIIKSGLPILARIRKGIDRIVEQKAGRVEIAQGLPEEGV